MTSIKPDVPAELDAIVLECLEKDPKERTQSASQVAVDLKRYRRESSRSHVSRMTAVRPALKSQEASVPPVPMSAWTRVQRLLPWAIAVVAVIVAIIVVLYRSSSSGSSFPAIQALIASPKGTNFHSFGQSAGPVIVSPDGRMLAFVTATPEGKTVLYLRKLDSGDAVQLPGTEGAYYPFWSWDSKWVGFFSTLSGKLKKVDVAGNPPVTICDAPNARGGSWGSRDVILFSSGPANPLWKVPAVGGAPTRVTTVDTTRPESSQRWPYFLPDGTHFLYFSRTASIGSEAEGDAIMASSLDGGLSRLIVNTSSNAAFASDYLLYMRGSTVLAQRFDPEELSLKGDAVAVAEGVINDPGFSLGVFSASQNGVLAYQTGVGLAGARMVIVDRQGKALSYLDDIIEHFWMRISPDGKRIALGIFEPKSRTQNVWMYDLARNSRTRFTSGLASDINPVWSPNGQRLAFTSAEATGTFSVHVRPSTGNSADETVLESSDFVRVSDWSPHGDALCLVQAAKKTQSDVMILSLDNERKVRGFAQSVYNEYDGRFSPDGRWLAYVSDETGQSEIYLRPYPGPGAAIKVSTAGGASPVWRRDGQELFYISRDNKTLSTEVRSSGPSLTVGDIRELFTRTPIMEDYDVFPDGKRFLINRVIEPTETDPVTVVVNWEQKLVRK